ncbi:hypothetical protein CTA1_6426 [Colletotrichum tanaceti]|uniref:Uncharacterized protein n=1 Tax=Colletotrichum tanaceti TaxID=1306861 RepID=A0A4U6XJ50_9PEZI|nr:hypothetical protein CTA1_6426 [Colletotrichum tanaceti]
MNQSEAVDHPTEALNTAAQVSRGEVHDPPRAAAVHRTSVHARLVNPNSTTPLTQGEEEAGKTMVLGFE